MTDSRTAPLAPPKLLVFVLAATCVALLASACGGDTETGSAEVSIDAFEPATTFPGVETRITFSITPGEGVSASDLSWEVDFGDTNSQTGEGTEGEVTHTWESSGQYPVEVAALSGDRVVGTARQTLQVQTPVDLEVSNVRPRPANVEPGDTLTASIDVANLSATAVQSPFKLHVFLTDQDSVEADEVLELTEVGRTDVTANSDGEPVLAGSGSREVGVEVTIPEETEGGDYHLVPWIDPEGDIADSTPENNFTVSDRIVRVSSAEGVLPDVVVEEVVAIPDRAFPALNKFSRTFKLTNEGGGEASNVVTKTYLSIGDDTLDEEDQLVNEAEEGVDVPAQETVTVGPDQFVLNEDITAMDGEKKVWIIVEATVGDDAAEADDSNNGGVSDPPITVSDQLADGPDVAVTDFSVSPRQTFLDGSLEVSLEVANQGNADVSTFFCGLYLGSNPTVDTANDPRFSSISITSLDSGESTDVDRTVTVSSLYDPGTYHIYVVCDPTGSLEESFRSNNQRIFPETVEITDQADVDLFVDSLDVPKTAKETETVKLTAKVCVSGSNPSGQTRGELYQTTGTQVDFEAEPFETFDIPNINPGDCADVPIEFEADCEDFEENYAYGVIIDSEDKLPEIDEENNRRTGSNTMAIQGEFCACTEDNFEPNNKPREAYGVTSGTTSGAVCDAGSCDFYKVLLEKNESLVVETTFRAEKGPLKTTLFDPSGLSSLDADSSPDRQQVGTFVVPSRGEYVYSVCGAEAGSRNLYEMNVQLLQQVAGVDLLPRRVSIPKRDTYSIGATVPLEFRVNNIGQTGSGPFDAALMISPDRDLSDNDNVSLTPATTQVTSVGGGGKVDHKVDVTFPTSLMDGEYWIGVKLDPSQRLGEASYQNNVAFSRKIEIKTRCFDALEPNDAFSDATTVSDNDYKNLVACAAADDYYKLCVPNAKKFDVSASFDDNKGDIDLELYDEQFNIVDSSANTGVDAEKVSVNYVNGDQCFFVRAFVLTTQPKLETTYDLSVNVQDVDPSLKCSSDFEPNNSFKTASSLVAAVQQSGKLDRCPAADTDFYRVQLNTGQTVSFRGIMDPASQPGTLRLQLYSPNQNPSQNVETAPGVATAEIKDFKAPVGGQYYLQVTLTGSQRRTTYRLEADGLGGVDLAASDLDFWPGTYTGGDPLLLDFKVANQRSDTATTPTYEVYLGDSPTLDAKNDANLGSFSLKDLAGNSSRKVVAPKINLPGSVSSGTGYIHVLVKTHSSQTDPNTANNVTTQTITLQP